MANTLTGSKRNVFLFALLLIFFSNWPNTNLFGQRKKDHIVLNDSAYTEGYVKIDKSDPLHSLFFKWRKKDSYKKYSVEKVTEFYENHRSYYKKTLFHQDQETTVFLQKLIYDNPNLSVYKWIGKKHTFYIDQNGKLELLGEDFRQVLNEKIDNQNLDPLLEITELNYSSLSYLLTSANSLQKPHTFSKFLRFTPRIGYSFISQKISIPNQNTLIQLNGTSPNLNLTIEAFPTYRRNLSILFSPTLINGQSSGFKDYQEGSSKFETDLQFRLSSILLPISSRYYFEINPNKSRVYFELGYGYMSFNTKEGVIDIAEYKSASIHTDTREFVSSGAYKGIQFGIGMEKYTNKTKGLTLGVSLQNFQNNKSENLVLITPSVGFKF